ncbi:hypothetical protein M422DRAFT_270508 [Sphaerobolus stellatus SS14]|uniref:Unplaced genomic scaffold SPHSTscaffold_237, whole genome shotgun sequence n=1 Tax=Sphaerobolus stellatus (strain SS14) TaxID=990650 RepID=A0A0C9TFN8_SPHS4|nr:hypothetical protein M422DRAFT_270508 [Sphaerobolus stellatus SS14]
MARAPSYDLYIRIVTEYIITQSLQSITLGTSGVHRNSWTAPGRAGPPIHNRQWTNHESSHNSIECYNCGKTGHIKPNCSEPIRAHRVGAVHVEDPPEGQVDNTDLDINDNIDDEHLDEDEHRNNEYDNQMDLSKDQCSKPSKFDWSDDDQHHQVNSVRYSHDLARIAAVVPIGLANARKAKIAKEGEPLYDHTVKMKTTRPTRSKQDLLTITGYFLVGGTKAYCLFDSSCEGIIMSSEFAPVPMDNSSAKGITIEVKRLTGLPSVTGLKPDYYIILNVNGISKSTKKVGVKDRMVKWDQKLFFDTEITPSSEFSLKLRRTSRMIGKKDRDIDTFQNNMAGLISGAKKKGM